VLLGLDHIAIAVPSIEQAVDKLVRDLGLSCSHQEVVAEQKTAVAFFPIQTTHIELVSPTTPDSPIQKFIEKRGGGLHHLCFETDDLAADMLKLKARGYRFINDIPQVGAHHHQVAWIHPQSLYGVLVELVQK